MDRRRSISLIVIAIVILIDDQMPAGGSTLVSGRSTNCGCFRGCILHGTHRTYDQQHYGASFLPVSFTKSSRIHRGSTPSIPSVPLPLPPLLPFSNVPASQTTIDHDERDHPTANGPSHFSFLFFFLFFFFLLLLFASSFLLPSLLVTSDPLVSVYTARLAQARTCTIGTWLNVETRVGKVVTRGFDATTADPAPPRKYSGYRGQRGESGR